MMLKIDNNTNVNFLGKELIKEIYKTAYRLNANYIVVNKARYNKYAEIELYEDYDCISWKYDVNVKNY